MATTLSERERVGAPPERSRLDAVLGHPVAFAATALILVALFGWTFFTNPGRPAPADDPAFYAWRTEALISDDPVTLLEVEGPQRMLVGGYRVITPVIAGFMRHVAGLSPLMPTVWLAVGLRVLIPLLLAGFAYRHRPDPLMFHSVALGSASLLPTPPFGGYLDNVLTLTFLSASLFFLAPARRSWPARVCLTLLLLASGLAHPTTLVIYCGVLGAMAALRLVARRFDMRSVLADDGPALAAAGIAVIAAYAVWKLGIWGQSAPLGEAAVPPPADSSFFLKRMGGWTRALRPGFNAPLLVVGIIGLVATGRRAIEDDFARPVLVWLLPLAGAFGFLLGIAYPYYRFFNTTASWLLLVGVGIFFVARFLVRVSHRGGVFRLALVGIAVLAWIVATNFSKGFVQVGWNDVEEAWISPAEIEQMDLVRGLLEGAEDRPVVFVTDTSAPEAVRSYGWLKLVANVSRYGVAPGQHDRAHVYLGPLDVFLEGRAADGPAPNFRELSQASLEDARADITDQEPIVVVASVFNLDGRNAELASSDRVPPADGAEVVVVSDNGVVVERGVSLAGDVVTSEASRLPHLALVLVGLVVLLVPGVLLVRWLLPDAGFAQLLGLVPTLSLAALGLTGIAALALLRTPFSAGLAWALVVGLSLALLVAAVRRRA